MIVLDSIILIELEENIKFQRQKYMVHFSFLKTIRLTYMTGKTE